MSMVKMVEAELKTEVREDMRAAIMTASIRPRSPANRHDKFSLEAGCLIVLYTLYKPVIAPPPPQPVVIKNVKSRNLGFDLALNQ
jgi:hypothetical protein